MAVEYREEPCRGALNRVNGMPFRWSLNPSALRARYGVADRRRDPLEPPPDPEQLPLAV